jgi:hypothetical protein
MSNYLNFNDEINSKLTKEEFKIKVKSFQKSLLELQEFLTRNKCQTGATELLSILSDLSLEFVLAMDDYCPECSPSVTIITPTGN